MRNGHRKSEEEQIPVLGRMTVMNGILRCMKSFIHSYGEATRYNDLSDRTFENRLWPGYVMYVTCSKVLVHI